MNSPMGNGRLIFSPSSRYARSAFQSFFRPAEVDRLIGDSSKARKVLGWRPRVTFDALVTMMVDSDLELAQRELRSRGQ